MADTTFGAIGAGDGLPISNDTGQAKALGFQHAELLRPFAPTQAICDDADALNAYVAGWNEGIRVAASHVVAIHIENRELKAKATGSTTTTTATQADLEREEFEARKYGCGNTDLENHKRQRAGLKPLGYGEFLARSVRLMRKHEREEPARQKQIQKHLGA